MSETTKIDWDKPLEVMFGGTWRKAYRVGPRWKHVCNACQFLGQHEGDDLYYCESHFPHRPGIQSIVRQDAEDWTHAPATKDPNENYENPESIRTGIRLAIARGYLLDIRMIDDGGLQVYRDGKWQDVPRVTLET